MSSTQDESNERQLQDRECNAVDVLTETEECEVFVHVYLHTVEVSIGTLVSFL